MSGTGIGNYTLASTIAATNAAIRKAMGGTKVFPCPGACGSCTGKGHACGMAELKGRVIAIAMH
jgi:hypothetical protein